MWLIVGLCAALAGVCVGWWWSWRWWRARLARADAARARVETVADVEHAEARRVLAAFARDHLDDLQAMGDGIDFALWSSELDGGTGDGQ